MATRLFTIPFPDCRTHVSFKIYSFEHSLSLNIFETNIHKNRFPRTGPQGPLVRLYNCDNKKLHNYAIKHVTQCESEPQAIKTTIVIATLYSKARAATLIGWILKWKFSEKKAHCSKFQMEIKIDLITNHINEVIFNHYYIFILKTANINYKN